MGKRREGREAALQFLYQVDVQKGDIDAQLATFWTLRTSPEQAGAPNPVRDFAEQLLKGVVERREAIDEKITQLAKNYELHRISTVDRNVLRLGIYEMLYREEVPPVVVINECIEIAKKFGSEKSGHFVNGILDRVCSELRRPKWAARTRPSPAIGSGMARVGDPPAPEVSSSP